MKDAEIEIGKVYAAKVGGTIQPLLVLERFDAFVDSRQRFWRTKYRTQNLRSKRILIVKSPQRFRRPWLDDNLRQEA